ncbi:hypothetical protein JB92DRAFT_2835686 [Gautieria morchelliformis]|nr:hypothetical protein JB92DRAFT_2835686 [Gautieria morchelliformis]
MTSNESACGSFTFLSTYPTRGFDWYTNNVDAINAGCQLVRRMIKRLILEEEENKDARFVNRLCLGDTSLTGYLTGIAFGFCTYRQTSAKSAVAYPTIFWKVVWVTLSLVSFGIGCWQIDGKRKLKESVLGMFIYWVPAVTLMDIDVCGFNVFGLLGIVGTVLGIISGNEKRTDPKDLLSYWRVTKRMAQLYEVEMRDCLIKG